MREDVLETPLPQPNEVPQRKHRRNAVPVLGVAGLSLSLASAATAAISGMSAGVPAARSAPSSVKQMTLHDEEITDVSLATFQVFEKEKTQRPRTRFAACGCGACGADLYYNPPVSSGPVYQPPPVGTTNKYRRSFKRK
jgi:hypothetical protein